jgi:TonB family protein
MEAISVRGGGTKSSDKPSKGTGATGGSKGSLFDIYYAKIIEEIRQEWAYPDMGKKQLEVVVSVLIERDGTIKVQRVEKSSGDLLFDKSALKALTKASPVTPPQNEMEIGITRAVKNNQPPIPREITSRLGGSMHIVRCAEQKGSRTFPNEEK